MFKKLFNNISKFYSFTPNKRFDKEIIIRSKSCIKFGITPDDDNLVVETWVDYVNYWFRVKNFSKMSS